METAEKSSQKLYPTLAIIFSLLTLAFTVFVALSGPKLALPFNEFFYQLTKYLGFLPFLLPSFYGFLFLSQFLRKKSLKKIDRELWLMMLFYVAVALVYLVFEHFLILNTRPIILDGVEESSYPSSHTLFSVSFCLSAILLNKNYVSEKYVGLLNILLGILMVVIVVGRFLSGVHWLTDIIGGILFAVTLVALFSSVKKSPSKEELEISQK